MKRICLLAVGIAALAVSSTSASACGGLFQAPCPRAKLTVVPMNAPPKPAPKAQPVAIAPAKTGVAVAPAAPLLGNNNGNNLVNGRGGSIVASGAGNIVASGAGNIVASGAGNFRNK